MGTETVPKSEEAVSAESPSDLEQQIIRQIEYYFGNYNLSRDKFLKEQITLDDGWVPLETMVKFNRLKKLSEDFNVIVEALKKSPKQLLEISEDSQKIRRRTAAPEDYRKQDELENRTLYVKGFKKTSTLDELLDFFKSYKVENILMRRIPKGNNRVFKGSCFVTFETKEDSEQFLETKGIKYCGTELLKETRKEYTKRKDEFYDNLRAEKKKKMESKAGLVKKEDKSNNANQAMVPDCLLKLTHMDENIIREDIKAVLEPFGTVAYVDFSKGKPSAVVRFETGVAKSVLEKIPEEDGEKKIQIGSVKSTVTLVEGEEEQEYWNNIPAARAQSRFKYSKGGNKGGKGRFKKWGKRPNEDDEADQPSKKAKQVEDQNENGQIQSEMDTSKSTEIKSEKDESENSQMKSEMDASENSQMKPEMDVSENISIKSES